MRKTITATSLFFLAFLFPSVLSASLDSTDREARVTAALDAVNAQTGSSPAIKWTDVCLASDKAANALSSAEGLRKDVLKEGAAVDAPADTSSGTQAKMAVTVDEKGNVTTGAAENVPAAAAQAEPPEAETKAAASTAAGYPEKSLAAEHPFDQEESFLAGLVNPNNPLNSFEVAPQASFYRYREPSLMKLKGYMYGMYFAATHRTQENEKVTSLKQVFNANSTVNMFKLDGYFNYGGLDYSSEGTGTDENEPNYVFHIRGLLGYDFPLTETFRLTPIAGFGYRYLLDDSGGRQTSTGHWGYDRESTYAYIPLGMEFFKQLPGNWTFTLNAEYDLFLFGIQKSHLGDVNPAFNTIKNDQKDGYGLAGSFRITKKNQRLDFYVEPFVYFWKIKDSEVSEVTYSGAAVGYGIEPENETTEYGVRLGVNF